jgi:hypothetical protein
MALGSTLTALGGTVKNLLASLNIDQCNILGKTTVNDGGGLSRETWAAINAQPLPCILVPKEGRKQTEAGRWEVVTDHQLTLAADAGIDPTQHRIEVLARGPRPLQRFVVDSDLPQMGVALTLKLKLITPSPL